MHFSLYHDEDIHAIPLVGSILSQVVGKFITSVANDGIYAPHISRNIL